MPRLDPHSYTDSDHPRVESLRWRARVRFDAGLPVGLQLAGRPFAEAALCRIGHAYERAAGWWRRRPPAPGTIA